MPAKKADQEHPVVESADWINWWRTKDRVKTVKARNGHLRTAGSFTSKEFQVGYTSRDGFAPHWTGWLPRR
jgi:hypothetical protein